MNSLRFRNLIKGKYWQGGESHEILNKILDFKINANAMARKNIQTQREKVDGFKYENKKYWNGSESHNTFTNYYKKY